MLFENVSVTRRHDLKLSNCSSFVVSLCDVERSISLKKRQKGKLICLL